MKKWHLIIDVEKCEDCNNCFLACKDEHVGNDWPGYTLAQPLHGQRWINIMRKERGQYPLIDVAYRPTPCMQCNDAPCIKASKGAITKRPDGIVLIDPQKAKGHKTLAKACPYGAIWWNEEQDVPQKCTLCAHLLDDGWKQPRCVQACPTGALRIESSVDDLFTQIVGVEELTVLYPEFNTSPNVYYKNLYRFDKGFIAGSVELEINGLVDCAVGVRVTLSQGNEPITQVETDSFGDFKFDHLAENSGKYEIKLDLTGYEKIVLEVDLGASVNIGIIPLKSVG